jgi:hypothetical protein
MRVLKGLFYFLIWPWLIWRDYYRGKILINEEVQACILVVVLVAVFETITIGLAISLYLYDPGKEAFLICFFYFLFRLIQIILAGLYYNSKKKAFPQKDVSAPKLPSKEIWEDFEIPEKKEVLPSSPWEDEDLLKWRNLI